MLRSLRNAANPISTGLSRWWCHSSLRARLRGKPQRARAPQRRNMPPPTMDERVRQERIAAIERILRDDEQADHG
jgi:hypothetical protein